MFTIEKKGGVQKYPELLEFCCLVRHLLAVLLYSCPINNKPFFGPYSTNSCVSARPRARGAVSVTLNAYEATFHNHCCFGGAKADRAERKHRMHRGGSGGSPNIWLPGEDDLNRDADVGDIACSVEKR